MHSKAPRLKTKTKQTKAALRGELRSRPVVVGGETLRCVMDGAAEEAEAGDRAERLAIKAARVMTPRPRRTETKKIDNMFLFLARGKEIRI